MTYPPPTCTPCPHCGEPLVPYTIEHWRFNDNTLPFPPLEGDPVHVPDYTGKFYFSCHFSRKETE